MRRTLALRTETLSELTTDELGGVVGAADATVDVACVTRITTEITEKTTQLTREACG